ncbi:MAG TPA: hypothetical protein VHV83_11900 [Armatimonadota bacterium]|nr:hypothetical protein [Armatimonadota bacterium]
MKLEWRKRIIATVVYALIAVAVAWVNREALYYLNAGVKFAGIAAIPLVFLFGYYRWDKSHPDAEEHWKKGLAASFTIVISLATVWLVFSAIFISIVAWMTPTDNVRKYDFIAGKWACPFTAHFPRPIPKGVQAVRFYYCPGAMQAAAVFELGYTTTPAKIDALYHEYSRRSTLTFTARMKDEYVGPANCVTEQPEDNGPFSEDYTLFFLDEKPPTTEHDWNHPQSHGVAISKKRCRVVFWAWEG